MNAADRTSGRYPLIRGALALLVAGVLLAGCGANARADGQGPVVPTTTTSGVAVAPTDAPSSSGTYAIGQGPVAPTTSTTVAPTGVPSPGNTPTGPAGSVVGFIDGCSGTGGPVTHVGGDIVALRAGRKLPLTSTGAIRVVPSDVVGRQHVHAGTDYHFTLPPGHYVIYLPHYEGGNVGSEVTVVIAAGATANANLPNDCK